MKLILIWITWFMWYLSNIILKPKKLTDHRFRIMEEKRGRYNPDRYKACCKMKFNLVSDFGYNISCECLKDISSEEKKIAILCHGFSCSKYASIKYAEMFLDLGYTVIIYDHRNHGLSGKAYTSMGFYEKHDLKKVVDWCVKTYGAECSIITHGESMGAVTVLLHLGIDNRIKCAIADCGYSDLRQLLKHQLISYFHLPHFLIPIESLLTYLRAGFWYKEVSPIQVVSNTDVPIIFIHGKKDCFVPTYMSRQMYECKKSKKAIYLVAKARHGESFNTNKKGYIEKVKRFIDMYN